MADNHCNCNIENTGIYCKCEKCKYHSTDNHCHAGSISIGPKNAEHSGDTVCDTFIAR